MGRVRAGVRASDVQQTLCCSRDPIDCSSSIVSHVIAQVCAVQGLSRFAASAGSGTRAVTGRLQAAQGSLDEAACTVPSLHSYQGPRHSSRPCVTAGLRASPLSVSAHVYPRMNPVQTLHLLGAVAGRLQAAQGSPGAPKLPGSFLASCSSGCQAQQLVHMRCHRPQGGLTLQQARPGVFLHPGPSVSQMPPSQMHSPTGSKAWWQARPGAPRACLPTLCWSATCPAQQMRDHEA